MSEDTIRILSNREMINEDLIERLEAALEKASEGNVEGFCLVILSDKIDNIGHFDDRLRMIGALFLALIKTADMGGNQ